MRKLLLIIIVALFYGLLSAAKITATTVDKIIFNSGSNIAIVNPDGTGYTVLGQGFIPRISPNGTKIAFHRITLGDDFNADLFIMNSDGTGEINLTLDNLGTDHFPAWSPDGTKIAFGSNRNGKPGIYVMNTNGSNVQLLVPDGDKPTWSPDGTKLAFEIEGPNFSSEIAVVNSDGSNFTYLTSVFGFDGHPAWSPDGTRIAWAENCNCGIPTRISTMHPDGTGKIIVYTPPIGGDIASPAWSPDSSTIIFSHFDPGLGSPTNYRLFSVPSGGGTPHQIYADSNGVSYPSWGRLSDIVITEVSIDIKPGSDPNCFNNNGQGIIPVAILGSSSFDATQVDPGTVSLDSQGVKAVGKSDKLLAHTEDANNDGYMDLVVQIQDTDGIYQVGDSSATLTGTMFSGQQIQGTDAICIVQ